MWKFQGFSVTQILREINFGTFEALKTGSSILSKRKLESKLRKQTEFLIIFEN